jgi:hypothetical protein
VLKHRTRLGILPTLKSYNQSQIQTDAFRSPTAG